MQRLKWPGEDQNLCIGIIREFDAAHWLNNYEGKCANIHGHTWKVECQIKSQRLNRQGMVIDFGIVKRALDDILAVMDHNIVNFIVDQPTAENIAKYIYDQMYRWLRDYSINKTGISYFLEKIIVYETKDNYFEFTTTTKDYEDWFTETKEKGAKASSKGQKEDWKKNKKQRSENIKKSLAGEEYRKKVSLRMIKNNPMHNRKNVERMMNSLKKAISVKPNKAELKLLSIFKQHKLDYKYVGDYSLIIDGKNPDFVNIKRKEIIDLFGRFWHSDDNDWYNTKNDFEERIMFFQKRDWKILIIWDDELNDPEAIVKKIATWRAE